MQLPFCSLTDTCKGTWHFGQNICLLTGKPHLRYLNLPRESISKISNHVITVLLDYLVLARPGVCVYIYNVSLFQTSFILLEKIKNAEMEETRSRQLKD